MLLQQGLGHGDAINDISVDPGRPCIVVTASRVGACTALTASRKSRQGAPALSCPGSQHVQSLHDPDSRLGRCLITPLL